MKKLFLIIALLLLPSIAHATTCYVDRDMDGYGVSTQTKSCTMCCTLTTENNATCTCKDTSPTKYYVGTSLDCDDTNASLHSRATYYKDADGDTWGNAAVSSYFCTGHQSSDYVGNGDDCDDMNAAISPDATEICDGIDNDCNGLTDEVCTTWYHDADSDTYGNASVSTSAMSQPSGYVLTSGDCNDSNSAINPDATEICDSIDNDCNGLTDEGCVTYYQDADSDTYGNASVTTSAMSQPSGYVSTSGDCNDSNSAINPDATEICDSIDNNCDGFTDEGAIGSTWYRDADSDGYGTSVTTTLACSKPAGYVATSGDCDDSNAAVHPGATEVCNRIDDNCNGQTDEGFTSECHSTKSNPLSGWFSIPSMRRWYQPWSR